MMESNTQEIDPSFFERLGRICTYWAVVESHLQALLAHMMQSDHLNMNLITQSVSGRTITDWLRHLIDLYIDDDEMIITLKELLSTADEIRAERNALVHGLWCPCPEPDAVLVNSLRLDRREILKDELTTLSDLDELLDRISILSGRLGRIGVNFGYYLS